ncbi:MAG: neutral/alkaline non-lysosomal ceramidase N-terminal domain-containing protein [Chlamydiota bacterium]
MKTLFRNLSFVFLLLPALAMAAIFAGIGKADLTPPIGTPSAGYMERRGQGMEGTHDPLLALALFIDNGEKKIALCSVDHLGFTYEIVQEITRQVHLHEGLAECEIYIASSHTHSGGGAYLNIPVLGEGLAGRYSSQITQFYIEKTADAIIQASQTPVPAKIGFGYGHAKNLSTYRGLFPTGIDPLSNVSLIKVTRSDDTPLAVLFNYPVHPTVLKSQNRLFSSDFVGFARDALQTSLGAQALYFNGAQGDILPVIFDDKDRFAACEQLGNSLSQTVLNIWNETETSDALQISTQKEPYAFKPKPTPFGLALPIDEYKSEMNLLVFNQLHAFLTIPGELSCIYDSRLKEKGAALGFLHVSIFGLTNDAHGYMILPESWAHKTIESGFSFGGENYGTEIEQRAEALLRGLAPK